MENKIGWGWVPICLALVVLQSATTQCLKNDSMVSHQDTEKIIQAAKECSKNTEAMSQVGTQMVSEATLLLSDMQESWENERYLISKVKQFDFELGLIPQIESRRLQDQFGTLYNQVQENNKFQNELLESLIEKKDHE